MSRIADEKIVAAVKAALEGSQSRERKFSQTVDLAVNLKDIDLSVPKNRIEEEVPLPHGRGKAGTVAIFASGELAVKSRTVADRVITPEEIETLAGDKKQMKQIAEGHAYFLAEAPLMTTIGKRLGTVLGPRGKMPRPVPPNFDPAAMVGNLRKTVKVRSKDRKTFHTIVGTDKMPAEEIADNIQAILARIETKLERGRQNIASIWVKTTMGPSVRVL